MSLPYFLMIDMSKTQWLEIKPTDDEKTRNRKKKLQKSFKNKKRFQDMDALTRKKQQNWQDFKTGKGAKKKVTPLFINAFSVACCHPYCLFYKTTRDFSTSQKV